MSCPFKSNVSNKVLKSGPGGRISNLPSELVERVLGSMPIRDAVRTSILSRRWRYNWTSLPHLILDQDFFRPIKLVLDEQLLRRVPKNKRNYCLDLQLADIVNNLLLLHEGPIHKFFLNISSFISCSQHHLDRWLRFLSRNGVKELILEGFGSCQVHPLKFSSSAFSSLTFLKLKCFAFEPPTSFTSFRYLTTIIFICVSVRTEVLEALISSTTLLKYLTLNQCDGVAAISINAPNLKYFCNDTKFTFVNATSLVEAHLFPFFLVDPRYKSNFFGVFSSLLTVEKLGLSKYAFGNFDAGGIIPRTLPTKLLHLKYLTLSSIIFSRIDEFLCALCLIRSSPNLHKLEILSPTFKLNGPDLGRSMKLIEVVYSEVCVLDKLQTVIFKLVQRLSLELYLIKFILASSPNLESMFILGKNISREAELRPSASTVTDTFLRASPKFQQASPKAKSPSFGIKGLNAAAMKLIEKAKSQGCLLDKLEFVRLEWVQDVGPEFHLIEFLLASSPKLKSMFVKCKCNTMEKELRVSRMLMMYPRASPKAKLICSSPKYCVAK